MGIQGLLPFLKKIHTPVNVSKFEGCTVAIDAYCWLHKGAFACADKLALGEKTDVYVHYCMKYLEYMLRKNIKPIMVFDGCRLPSKQDVEKSRREKREMYRKKAAQMLREGKRAEARECLQRCIDISPEMALEVMNTCRARGIDCIVAPYEADAQLAFLCKQGIAQAIITEDSDLLLFGCKQVIFKMDHFGNGVLIESCRLNEVLGISEGFYTFDKFRYMCIMSGCDYLPSLPGIGLGKASKVFKLARQPDLQVLLKKFPSTYLKMSLSVPQEYIDNFIKADNTFLYQLVFNPLRRELVPLNPYPPEINRDQLNYAGPYIPANKALHIALGNINIYTMQMFANFDPDTYVPPYAKKKTPCSSHTLSMWNKLYRVRPKFADKGTEEVTRPNLQGKEQTCALTFKRRSPIKRQRTVEESVDTRSDSDLSGMYKSKSPLKEESINKCVPEDEPCSKRARINRLTDESEITDSGQEEDPEVLSTPKKGSSPEDRRKFMSSLQEADTVVSVNTLASPDQASPRDKENCLQSPKRNKFAVLMNKRPRFDINAKKEVKSRYFASTSDKNSPTTNQQNNEGGSDQTTNSPQQIVKTESNSPITKSKVTSPEPKVKLRSPKAKVNLQGQIKASPGSVFSWSKFKFCKQAENQSPKVNSQFKQMVSITPRSKNSFQKSLSSSELDLSSSENTRVKDELVSASQPNPSCYDNSSQNSQTAGSHDLGDDLQSSCNSVRGSIDSFCMTNSQTSQDKPPSLPVPPSSVTYSDTEEDASQSSTTSASLSVSPTVPRPVLGGVTKKACRVSGLSRGQKTAKSKVSKAPDKKQCSIKDLFSKFSHKRSAPKLSHSEKTVIKDEEVGGMTPSTDNKLLSAVGGVQRKLL